MSANREHDRVDAVTAERLLGGETVADHERLAGLLAAAAAPARPGELAGETAAVLAFRAAHRHPVSPRRNALVVKPSMTRFLTVKIAAIVIAIGGVGGVAVAAGTGNLPDPVQRHVPGVRASTSIRPQASARPSITESDASIQPLRELCSRYSGRSVEQRRQALEDGSEFRKLTDSAGSRDRDRVDRFCDDLRRGRGGIWQGRSTASQSGFSQWHGETQQSYPNQPTEGQQPGQPTEGQQPGQQPPGNQASATLNGPDPAPATGQQEDTPPTSGDGR
ncbi:MAG: hypothetical protein JXA67_17020 [Micromonosporaceae bacterium]|nr:hypothetical protein [Micromonosporaceae bacterium]